MSQSKIIVGILVLGMASMWVSKDVKVLRGSFSNSKSSEAPLQERIAESTQKIQQASGNQVITEMRKSFLGIILNQEQAQTREAFALLGSGLMSDDTGIHNKAASYVESLLIDVSHGTHPVHPAYENDLRMLFTIYKTHAREWVEKTEKVFPQSLTLAYLKNLEGN